MNDRRTRPAPEVDSLPPIEADDDAGKIYRRLLARRRRWTRADQVSDDEAGTAAADAGPAPTAPEDATRRETTPETTTPETTTGDTAAHHAAARDTTTRERTAHDTVPPFSAGTDAAPRGGPAPTAGPHPSGGADGGRPRPQPQRQATGFDHDTRADPGVGAGPGTKAAEGDGDGDGDGSFSLHAWQPRSHTMRFVKEHPALALAIAVPAVVLLTRKGAARRAMRYATSPAGMERIRQLSTVITMLGLLDKSDR